MAKKARWENEKESIGRAQKIREQIEKTNAEIEKAENGYDLRAAAELKYGKLPELKRQLAEAEANEGKSANTLLRDSVN